MNDSMLELAVVTQCPVSCSRNKQDTLVVEAVGVAAVGAAAAHKIM